MTQIGSAPASYASNPSANRAPFVEWGAVFAGAVLAAALSFVLLTFGTAIGLSAVSPWPNSGLSARVIGSLAVFWIVLQQIGAFMAGGYIAGRMRSRWHEANPDEVEFRDGLHGGLVWGIGIVIGAALFLATAGAAARTGAEVVSNTGSAVLSSNASMDVVLDTMLRPTVVAQAATPPSASSPSTAARPRTANAASAGDDTRAEMARILSGAVATGSLSQDNQTYLAQVVAQRSGISQQEAERRVSEAFTKAREAADKTRRAAVLTGLVTAASLILSLGAAWWAAIKGGQHRDNAVPARFAFGQRPPRPRTP